MQITARAHSKWTGNTWSVVDSPLEQTQLAAMPEGSVSITFSTVEVALSGRFNMETSLGREEIEAIHECRSWERPMLRRQIWKRKSRN